MSHHPILILSGGELKWDLCSHNFFPQCLHLFPLFLSFPGTIYIYLTLVSLCRFSHCLPCPILWPVRHLSGVWSPALYHVLYWYRGLHGSVSCGGSTIQRDTLSPNRSDIRCPQHTNIFHWCIHTYCLHGPISSGIKVVFLMLERGCSSCLWPSERSPPSLRLSLLELAKFPQISILLSRFWKVILSRWFFPMILTEDLVQCLGSKKSPGFPEMSAAVPCLQSVGSLRPY